MTERVLLRATNLRDLGGYVTGDGRRIKPGLLLRGGHMADLDAAGHDTYCSLGLRAIVDLRRGDEIADRPTPQFGDEANVQVSVSEGDQTFRQLAGLLEDPTKAGEIVEGAAGYYAGLITQHLQRFVPVFDVLLDPARLPALFHCTAGKDRTGFTAAAILKWLDVSDEVVFADYLLTNDVRGPYIDERAEELRRRWAGERGIDPSAIADDELVAFRALLGVEEAYLRSLFGAVEEHYGDWHNLRRQGLGIDDATISVFADAVTE